MTSPDDTGLLERLRDTQYTDQWFTSKALRNPDGPEAAARIEALGAEVEELAAENARLLNAFDGLDEHPVGEGET